MAPPALATDSSSYSTLILTVSWILASLTLIAIALRFWSGYQIVGRLRYDFWIAFGTFLVAFIAECFLTVSVHWGLGQHIDTLTGSQIVSALEFSWIFQIMDIGAMAGGKLAIIAALLHLRGPHDPKPWFLWAIGLTSVIFNALTIVFLLLQCSPVQKLWNSDLNGACNGRPLNQHFAFFSGAWSAFCDFSLALYPTTILWKLQMAFRLKLGLCILMGVGLITAVCSAIRTSELASLSKTQDPTYDSSPLIIWTNTEVWVILILGCVPPIRPLFVHFFRKTGLSTNSLTTAYGRHTNSKHIGLASMDHDVLPGRGPHSAQANVYIGKGSGDNSWENIIPPYDRVVVTTDIAVDHTKRHSNIYESSEGSVPSTFYKPEDV